MFEILSHWLGGLTPGSQLSRRAWLEIYYTPKGESDVKDISEDVSKYFLSLSWSDNMSGRVDDVTLTLEDRGHLWSSSWFPTQGSTLSFVVHTYNWKNLSDGEKTLDLGQFEIDEIEITGMPSTVQIKAVSAASDNTLRGVKRNRTWEEISIKKCATDICDDNAVKLFWDCASDPNLDHIEQSDQSDLDFLQKVTGDAGLSLKVQKEQVIIFDEEAYEGKDPAVLFLKPGTLTDSDLEIFGKLTGYSFRAKTRDTYKACHVKYQHSESKTLIEATFADPDKTDGKTLEVSEQVDTVAEAEKLARKKLREANREEVTGSMSMPGTFDLYAGQTVQLANFGAFDGKYIVTKVSSSIGTSFTTTVEIRRCLDGY